MKKLILSIIITIVFSGFSFSQEFTKENYYKLHNKSLDVILKDINSNSKKYLTSENPKIETLTFLKSYLSKTTDIDKASIEQFYLIFLKNDYLNTSEYKEVVNSNYFIEITKITNNNVETKIIINKFHLLLEKLNKDNNIKTFTKDALKSALLIGIESAEYWGENQIFWDESGNPSSNKKMNPHLAADIQGAVGGAVTGAITGGGVGALPGACLGAAWGSAASAVWHYFGW